MTLTDARSHVTRYAYDDIDRVATRTDPLSRAETTPTISRGTRRRRPTARAR